MPSETPSDRFRRHFPIPPPPFQRAFFIKRKISRHSRAGGNPDPSARKLIFSSSHHSYQSNQTNPTIPPFPPTTHFSASFPRKRESRSVEFQSFLINSCSFEFLDSHFRGNDGIRVFVRTDPSFPRKRESGTRPHGNLYFVITPTPPCLTPPQKKSKKPNLTKSDKI